MKIDTFEISGPCLFTPRVFSDSRGAFAETFKQKVFNEDIGERVNFVQDNQSLSVHTGTIRGLHYQSPPRSQGKLVRVISGRVIDIGVDIRSGSPTYGQHIRAELSADNAQQLWVPSGFLHGFMTLEPNTIVAYKVTDYYAPDCDGSVRWNDPELGLDWGYDGDVTISEKDAKAVLFSDFQTPF